MATGQGYLVPASGAARRLSPQPFPFVRLSELPERAGESEEAPKRIPLGDYVGSALQAYPMRIGGSWKRCGLPGCLVSTTLEQASATCRTTTAQEYHHARR